MTDGLFWFTCFVASWPILLIVYIAIWTWVNRKKRMPRQYDM